jgi:hypothetical protein
MKKAAIWLVLLCGAVFVLAEMAVASDVDIKFGGFGQFQYYYEQGNNISKFVPKRVRFKATGTLTDRVGFFVQHDFWGAGGTPPAPRLLDARFDYTICPCAKLSAGQFALPFGIETPISPYSLDAITYSYMVGAGWPQTPGPTGFFPYIRDLGVMLWGTYPKNNLKAIYNLAVFNGGGYDKSEENQYKDVIGRLAGSYKWATLGWSYYYGKTDSGTTTRPYKDKVRFGGDLKLDRGPFLFQTEFIQGWDDTITRRGYYALAEVKLWKVLQPVIKYDVWDPNTNTGNNQINKIAGGLNWYFSPNSKLQAIYEIKGEESDSVATKYNDDFILQWGMNF